MASRSVALLVLIVCGSGLAFVLTELQGRAVASRDNAYQALNVIRSVRVIDGLEWRVIAGEDPAAIAKQVEVESVVLLRAITFDRSQSEDATKLATEAQEYTTAVTDLVRAFSEGDRERGLTIDETRVDPGFESVIARADRIAASQRSGAVSTERVVRRLTWSSTVLVLAVLAMFLRVASSRKARQRINEIKSAEDRRFRSLIESTNDVILIVGGDDDVTVMTPTLGPLTEFLTASKPSSINDILQGPAKEAWEAMDRRVRDDGGRQDLELTLTRTDGSSLWMNAHGSRLVDSQGERVWALQDITARKELELLMTHQAFHDGLTGVANRSLLHNRVEHALSISARSGAPVTLLFCDLDDFKTVNDTLGHALGDELLSIITKRMSAVIRDGDTLARLGGDEFAILLEDADLDKATAVAERMLSVISYEVKLSDRTIFPSMSIGIAPAAEGITTDELLRNADLAMYSSKRSGKGRSTVFQDRMHSKASEFLSLQSDLRNALENDELRLHYQATVDLGTGAVEGVEALLRWVHPVLGDVTPDRFIPVAEATGLIVPIGRWVIGEACRAGVELQDANNGEPLLMHVNLSPQQLRDPTIVSIVKEALEQSGLAPELLVLEVTEGVLLDNEVAVERLHELHALGVLMAIDDFGTGYTSINYLQGLPVQILKIDRSFISGDALDPSQRNAFLSAIVGLAKNLNLRSVAEGIEEESQLTRLKELGCDAGQGFLWTAATTLSVARDTIMKINAEGELEHAIQVIEGHAEYVRLTI